MENETVKFKICDYAVCPSIELTVKHVAMIFSLAIVALLVYFTLTDKKLSIKGLFVKFTF